MSQLKRGRACLALAWLTLAGAASAGELLIEQRVADDGALLVRYTPPEGVRELPLFDRSQTMAIVWGEMATPLDSCATITLKPRVTLQLNEGCTSATFRITPRVLSRRATYEPAFAIGPSAVMSYTGYYAAALPGHALRWRWVPGDGARAVVSGRVATQAVDRAITAEQVAFAAKDGGNTAAGWAALAANEYSFLGKAAQESLPGGVLIYDGKLDAARLEAVRSTLGSVTARLARAYGVMPADAWAVVASVSSAVRSTYHGDVTAGRMMSLRFNDTPPRDLTNALRQTRWFVSHEVTHWWDTGVFRTDMDRPWIHEGHADWMAGLLMLDAGQTDAATWRADMDTALNNCQLARRERPVATLPTGFNGDDPYACGHVTWLLAQSLRPRDAAPVDIAASLFRGSTAPIDAAAIARWADGPTPGAMRSLLLDPKQGWLSALKRDWGDVIEATELKAGDTLPQPLRGRLTGALMAELMNADCGRMGFWTNADHFLIEAVPACKTLRGDMRVRRIAGVSPFDDPVGAWLAVRAACTAGQPIALGTDGPEPTALPCPSPAPDMPIRDLLRLRPQAMERLGLGR